MAVKPHIEIDIDTLILRGYSMRDAYIIREAIEHQLIQELYNKGFSSVLPAEIHLDQLTVNPILIRPDSPARSVGYDVANTIAKGFTHIESPKNVP